MRKSRGVVVNILSSVGLQGVGMIVSLAMMPIYLRYFDDQVVLGLWFTMVAVLSWMLTFDFGIGNGLRNRLAVALALGETIEARSLIGSGYLLAASMGTVLLLGSGLLVAFADWNAIFNVPAASVSPEILRLAVFVAAAAIAGQFVLRTISSILLAVQQAALANSTGLFTNLLLLVAIVILPPASDDSGALLALSVYFLIAVNLPLAVLTVIVFSTFLRQVRPRLQRFDRAAAKSILGTGIGFVALQALALILFNTKDILIAQLGDPAMVVEFQIYNRVFNFANVLAWVALAPIWSAVTAAYHQGDLAWIGSAYRRLKQFLALVLVGLLALVFSFDWLVGIWLGDKAIPVDPAYAGVFAANTALYIWWGVLASFANGVGRIRTQLLCAVFGAIIYFPAAFALVDVLQSWIGIIVAGCLSMLPYSLVEPRNIRELILGRALPAAEGGQGSDR